MPARPRSAASVIKYRKAAFIAAAIGTAAALLTCALLGMGRTAYESQAVLSYSPDSLSTAEVSMLSAETVAAKALDDAHLVSILDGFGLYPEMRQGASQTAALDRLRSNISLRQDYVSQKGQVDLHLVYRDESPLKGPSVANALANVLAAYTPPGAALQAPGDLTRAQTPPAPVPAAPVPPAPVAAPPAQPKAILPPPLPPTGSGNLAGLTKDQLRRKLNWIDGELADMATEQSSLHAQALSVQSHISQIQASGRAEATAPKEPSRPVADPSAGARAQLTQQLTAEQQKLAALRNRYTDAYPDVQASAANVAQLQARLAALPPVPRPSPSPRPAPDLYQKNVDELTVQESHLGEKLRDIEHQIAGLEHRREEVSLAMQNAPATASTQAQAIAKPAPAPTPSPAPPARVQSTRRATAVPSTPSAALPSSAALSALAADDVAGGSPFRLITPATASVPVQRLSPMVFAVVGGALVIFLLVCLVPLMLMRSAVITNEADLRATLPRQVAYLGNVRRIHP